LESDEVVFQDENFLITRWHTIRPKPEFSHGISLYCLENGWKISKFFDSGNHLTYIYCDIIDTEYDKETDTYVFTDLLADVIIENDSLVRVVDLDELADACDDAIISHELLCTALRRLDGLLTVIYSGKIRRFIDKLDEFCV
jgi:predicted RNA-binding protein associated with RNAse of E/G family